MYNLDQYLIRESPVHKQDPRVKIIAVTALSIVILNAHIPGLLAATALALVISQLARIPLSSLVKTWRPFRLFFFILFLLYILFTPGPPLPLFPLGPVTISYPGLQLGLMQVWKFLLLVVAASILNMTTSPTEITMGLQRLLLPLGLIGISSYDIAMMVSLALRFLPTLIEEMKVVTEAQLSRGANFNPRRLTGKIRAMTFLAVPLSLNVFRRSDELIDAMEARGYQPGPRTYLQELEFTSRDWLLTGAIIVVMIAVLVCQA